MKALEKLAAEIDRLGAQPGVVGSKDYYERVVRPGYAHPPDTALGKAAYTVLLGAAKRLGAKVKEVKAIDNGALGVTNAKRGIQIVDTGNKTGMAMTLAHELGHWTEHTFNIFSDPGPRAEMQAEATSFVVMDALGVDKTQAAYYIGAEGAQGKDVLRDAETIERGAKIILAAARES